MVELEEEINPQKLEDFKFADVDPVKRARRIHCLKIASCLLAIILIIVMIPIIVESIRRKNYVEINCKFSAGNEIVQLINEKAFKKLKFDLSINSKKEKATSKYKFKKSGEYKVSFTFHKKLTSLRDIFNNFNQLKEIDLSKVNPDAFQDITKLFTHSESLEKVIFGKKKIKYMEEAFSGCNSLKELDLTSFNTKNVESMARIFSGCHSLTSVDLSSFDTKNVNTMEGMFSGCYSIENISLENFNFTNVEDMSFMFSNCENLTNITFGESNTTNLI